MTLHSLFEMGAKVLGDLDGGYAILDLLRRFVNGLAILLNAQRPAVGALQGRVAELLLNWTLRGELKIRQLRLVAQNCPRWLFRGRGSSWLADWKVN